MHIVLPVNYDNALGQTQNISASGIYATFPNGTAQHVQPGSSVRLELLFEHADPDGPLKVACGAMSYAWSGGRRAGGCRPDHVVPVRRRGGVGDRVVVRGSGRYEPRPIARRLDPRTQGRRMRGNDGANVLMIAGRASGTRPNASRFGQITPGPGRRCARSAQRGHCRIPVRLCLRRGWITCRHLTRPPTSR